MHLMPNEMNLFLLYESPNLDTSNKLNLHKRHLTAVNHYFTQPHSHKGNHRSS